METRDMDLAINEGHEVVPEDFVSMNQVDW